ncbi:MULTISPECIES: conjugative transfer system coupling protein TraD [unclassified Burkholderia]|uniref:conjugative transfer system coupling protein TraD n=1 Tax=Burkholderia TaxID=32008 RepID=UPI0014211D1D|nr:MULTISPECIES: conjugative transfer system coupling protein TraD [unclassified Burkholderia]NIE81861.1 conjugative transfer system coupling protein TraD [Burkholderia sp. Tr-860]NIF61175.1 conjugative transfer system coupling protein TraD [Burkholderia sp. Cy-647]NIF93952.1 conjugative transfer system coupling protein TraD [Burkholderia sp. Ax-1720]
MKGHINHFRPIYEVRGAIGWLMALLVLPLSGMPYGWVFALFALAMFGLRSGQVWRALKFRMGLSTKWLTTLAVPALLAIQTRMRAEVNAMYLGTGFEWTQKHCQMAHDILRMPTTEIPGLPKWLPKTKAGRAFEEMIENLFAPKDSIRDRTPQGVSWTHGLEAAKGYVPFHYKAMGGHTAVGGTTGSGKTRCYEVITTQVIHGGDVLIDIDPKNDKEWKARAEREAERTGRKFLYFNQAKPSESIRLEPLESWSQPSEIPSRIAQLMEEGPFRSFAFLFISRSVNGELYIGDKPNLRSILKYAQLGIDPLLEKALMRFFIERGLIDWEQLVTADTVRIANKPGSTRVDAMISLYQARFGAQDRAHEAIDGLIATHLHDREHYMRIIASALPLLQMLATGETGLMLAPKVDDFEDEREIWTIEKVIRQKAVLHIGLDSLSNSIVAKAIASMILADVSAVCGAVYNFYDTTPEVVLVIDEIAEAINEQVIQILNKGRGAGFKAFVAFQTRADLEAKLGNAAKMLQVLGNLNNQIILRLEDTDTAEWFSKKVGDTAIRNLIFSSSTSKASEGHVGEFTGSVTRSQQLEAVPLIPTRLIQTLPNLQYFMRISGGAVYQGRIPILTG